MMVDFCESRLLLGQRKGRLIDDLHAQCRLNAFSLAIGDAESNARLASGLIDGSVERSFDLEFIGRLDENHPVIAHRTPIVP
jgi:hypothetical protein